MVMAMGSTNPLWKNYDAAIGLDNMITDYSSGLGALDTSIGSSYSFSPYSMNSGILGFGGGMQEIYNMDPKQRLTYMTEYQKEQLKSNAELKETTSSINLFNASSENSPAYQAGKLKDNIDKNQRDMIKTSYGGIEAIVRKKFREAGYTNVSDSQVKAAARELYTEATGTNIMDDIDKSCGTSFRNGFVGGLGFGVGSVVNAIFNNGKNPADIKSDITGELVPKSERLKEGLGWITSAALTAVAGYVAVKHGGNLTHSIAKVSRQWKLNSADRALSSAKAAIKGIKNTPENAELREELITGFKKASRNNINAENMSNARDAKWKVQKAGRQVRRATRVLG